MKDMKTSVDYLKNNIEQDSIALYDGFITFTEFMENLDRYYSKAKEMEKQQKEVDYQSGYLDCYTKIMSERLTRDV
jgi:hypothetical protein